MRSFALIQQLISLVSFAVLIAQFSIWAMVLLILAGLPAFIAETKFSGDAFRLFRFRAPESRLQNYLEIVLAREDHVQEVKLFGLGATAAGTLPRDFSARSMPKTGRLPCAAKAGGLRSH